jgi:MraZ protein
MLRASGEAGVAIRGRYQGHGIGLVDDKGRVAIPAALRATLAANAPRADGKDGGTIIVGAHEQSPCLVAYDPAYIEVKAAQLDLHEAQHTAPDGSYDWNIQRRAASGEPVPFDGSGRFIMPAFPRFHAGITAHAFFYGALNRIEIWDPQTLIDDATVDPLLKKMVRFYMAEKGVEL